MIVCTLTLYCFILAMTTQYKTMQTKKNYTIHQLERELAQTTKQLSKRERGRNLSLIIMEREKKRVRERESFLKFKTMYIHIKIHPYFMPNICSTQYCI